MKPLNLILGGIMIIFGFFILYMAVSMFQHAFRDISGYIQGAIVVVIGLALTYFGYKRAVRE